MKTNTILFLIPDWAIGGMPVVAHQMIEHFETRFDVKLLLINDITHGLIYSQRVLLKLVEAGYAREQAYDIVQPMTAKAWDENKDFRTMLEADPRVTDKLSEKDLDDAFDYHWHLRNVDEIFKRVGLE